MAEGADSVDTLPRNPEIFRLEVEKGLENATFAKASRGSPRTKSLLIVRIMYV